MRVSSANFAFAKNNWNNLLFGAVLLTLSSFGQTYLISVFGQKFRSAFHLSNWGLGSIYALGTVLSALLLIWTGRLIDHMPVRRYTWFVAALLAAACLLTAISSGIVMLCLSFCLLRLGGQGLMVHTAQTVTARAFPRDAGKALGLINIGFSIAQATIPVSTIAVMNHIGWRETWAIGACLVVVGTGFALLFLTPTTHSDHQKLKVGHQSVVQRLPLWKDKRLLLALPAILSAPFVTAGFFFHQTNLAVEKHWTLKWVGAWFFAYAAAQTLTLLFIGPIIDRYRPQRILPFFLGPQCIGMLLVALSDSAWITPFYLALTGISQAASSTLGTALWVDFYGPAQLARVRAFVEAGSVIATGASPIIMGILLDRGVPLSVQALCMSAGLLVTSVLTWFLPERQDSGGKFPGP